MYAKNTPGTVVFSSDVHSIPPVADNCTPYNCFGHGSLAIDIPISELNLQGQTYALFRLVGSVTSFPNPCFSERSSYASGVNTASAGAALLIEVDKPACGRVLWAALAVCENDTPKRKKAIFFAPNNADLVENSESWVKRCLEAENYEYVAYKFAGNLRANVKTFKEIAEAQDYGVFVMHAHGAKTSLAIEEFPDEVACNAAIQGYKETLGDDAAKFANHLICSFAQERRNEEEVSFYNISITEAGLNKLFGDTDSNRPIVFVAACNSFQLQTNNDPKPFGNTEFIGYSGQANDREVKKSLRKFFWRMSGYEGISKRLLSTALADNATAHSFKIGRGRVERDGTGTTTLAPPLSSHTPVPDTVLQVPSCTPGSVVFDTKMDASKEGVVTLEGCGAELQSAQWVNMDGETSCEYKFEIKIQKNGRLIVRVDPDRAVSKNNGNRLIGNIYVLDPDWDSDDGQENKWMEADKPPFGKSGHDGIKQFPPDPNPFRWSLWCGEKPESPSRNFSKDAPEQSMADPFPRFDVPIGEALTFVIFDPDPVPGLVMIALDAPPNFAFEQVGSWYAHVIFTPDPGQLGEVYEVTFESSDADGLRFSQTAQFAVADPLDSLIFLDNSQEFVVDDLGEAVVSPGESADHLFVLINNGNTKLRDLQLVPTGRVRSRRPM